uniref:Kazal-like domain-containing protein n=1 Tax=Tetraselmis sp. GSL018 TaxID=582737 RepID=A0A061REF1_9CHLO
MASKVFFAFVILVLLPSEEGRVLQNAGNPRSRTLSQCPCSIAESTFGPVCTIDGKYIAVNTCTAVLCLDWSVTDLVPCNNIPESRQAECSCPDSDTPVCLVSGTPVAPSRCHAECIGPLAIVDYSEIYCRGFGSSAATPVPTAISLKFVDYASLPSKPGCDCLSAIREPVCDEAGVEVAVNRGCARCTLGLAGVRFSEELCPEAVPVPQEPVQSSTASFYRSLPRRPGCICIEVFDPVCDRNGIQVASNLGCARCILGLGDAEYSSELCHNHTHSDNGTSSGSVALIGPKGDGTTDRSSSSSAAQFYANLPNVPGCLCAAEFDPVCDENGVVVAVSSACARCKEGLEGIDYSAQHCGAMAASQSVSRAPGSQASALVIVEGGSGAPTNTVDMYASLPMTPGCACPMVYEPVCDLSGVRVAVNAKCAQCKMGLDGVTYSARYCFRP